MHNSKSLVIAEKKAVDYCEDHAADPISKIADSKLLFKSEFHHISKHIELRYLFSSQSVISLVLIANCLRMGRNFSVGWGIFSKQIPMR